MTTEAGSGHPTSCLSCAEIVAALTNRLDGIDTRVFCLLGEHPDAGRLRA